MWRKVVVTSLNTISVIAGFCAPIIPFAAFVSLGASFLETRLVNILPPSLENENDDEEEEQEEITNSTVQKKSKTVHLINQRVGSNNDDNKVRQNPVTENATASKDIQHFCNLTKEGNVNKEGETAEKQNDSSFNSVLDSSKDESYFEEKQNTDTSQHKDTKQVQNYGSNVEGNQSPYKDQKSSRSPDADYKEEQKDEFVKETGYSNLLQKIFVGVKRQNTETLVSSPLGNFKNSIPPFQFSFQVMN